MWAEFTDKMKDAILRFYNCGSFSPDEKYLNPNSLDIDFEFNNHGFPIYTYAQPYEVSYPIKRIITPKNPLKVAQLHEKIQQ